jgi:selenide, water dikinase
MNQENILTSISKGSGCGCKIQPAVLSEMLNGLSVDIDKFPNLLVGNHLNDDCSVYDLGDGKLLLQTVDFFTPMVNDPSIFGMAAAANALSDIYAMGGKPIMANAVFSWPLDLLPVEMGKKVLKGGIDLCLSLGVPVAGGHSIDGKEPIFGLSVTGLVDTANLKTNAGAQLGDVVFMTKPLGIGMLAAAYKRGISTKEQNDALHTLLTQNNSIGYELGKINGVTAMTDITGFGLVGHLLEICKSSNLGAEIEFNNIPLEQETKSLAASFVLPDNAMRNWNAYEKDVQISNQDAFAWVVDPQTNGGLLFTVNEQSVLEVKNLFESKNLPLFEIGKMVNSGVVVR